MRIFFDTVNLDIIREGQRQGILDGITTNPSLLSKEIGNIVELLIDICKIIDPLPVNIEITETNPKSLYEQARKIASIAPNVVVKIPCHKNYIEVINKLVKENIKVNITLLFSVTQALFMCKLGVNYISPFVGRLSDIDVDGIQLISDIRKLIDNYNFETQILAASLRSVSDVSNVALAGADIATIPVNLIEKLFNHPLSDIGIKKFAKDWEELDIKSFP